MIHGPYNIKKTQTSFQSFGLQQKKKKCNFSINVNSYISYQTVILINVSLWSAAEASFELHIKNSYLSSNSIILPSCRPPNTLNFLRLHT